MTEADLIERLAIAQHDSWSRYVEYLLSKCETLPDGSLRINVGYVASLYRQIKLHYHELRSAEQQADRDEVAHILPIIQQYAQETERMLTMTPNEMRAVQGLPPIEDVPVFIIGE